MIYFKDLGYFKLIQIDELAHVDELLEARRKCRQDWAGETIVLSLESPSFNGTPGFMRFLMDLNLMAQQKVANIHVVGAMPELQRLVKGMGEVGFHVHSHLSPVIHQCLKAHQEAA
jgi:hypothetical protein